MSASTSLISCNHCSQDSDNLFVCSHCQKVITFSPKHHFEVLGFEPTFDIDLPALEERYLQLSRMGHPDFYSHLKDDEHGQLMQRVAQLNEAYRILKDPLKRADHLVILWKGPDAASQKESDPAFLMESLELREAFESASEDEKQKLKQELEIRQQDYLNQAQPELKSDGDLKQVRQLLNRINYLKSLVTDGR